MTKKLSELFELPDDGSVNDQLIAKEVVQETASEALSNLDHLCLSNPLFRYYFSLLRYTI